MEKFNFNNLEGKLPILFKLANHSHADVWYGGPLYRDINRPHPLGPAPQQSIFPTLDEFLAAMRDWAEKPQPTKEANLLICLSVFGDFLNRQRASVEATSGLWLDNDGGRPHPKDFSANFRYRHVIYSSYNATPEKPKYRVYIPADQLLTGEDYSLLNGMPRKNTYYSFLVEDIFRCFPGDWDESKKYVESLFYIPCRNPNSDCHFFWVADYSNFFPIEAFRSEWKENQKPIEEHKQVYKPPTCSIRKQMRIEKALDEWQPKAPQDDKRSKAFFRLTLQLLKAGCDEAETAAILESQCHYSRVPESRRRQIPTTISNAKKYLNS